MEEAVQLQKGLFITVEGGEGSGKSSLLRHLSEWLTKHEVPHVRTREPGGTLVAEELRALLLHAHKGNGMLPLTELLIILAARLEHVEKVIFPALDNGSTVLCDRFVDSTMAYQAYGRGYPAERVWDLSIDIVPLLPDLTFYLDVSPEIALPRVERRQQGVRDRLEAEDVHFHERVREGFLTMARQCQDRIVVLDASMSEEALTASAIGLLAHRLGIKDGLPC
jgi:dTMP kinase